MESTTHAAATEDAHASHHEEPGFWQKYIFSTDHKVIGLQYGITGLMFLFMGFCLMTMMRWQLAYPGHPIPIVGKLLFRVLGEDMVGKDAAGHVGVMMPGLYNSFGAMHGTIMV